MAQHQRKNASSNTKVGSDFECLTLKHFIESLPTLQRPFWLPIGHIVQKEHKFDLGCVKEKVIIECKSHTWTEGGNVPSAKLTTWDQAMLYFFLAPRSYRKIFVVKKNVKPKTNETLAAYYLRTHRHVIPDEVEFWEIDEKKNSIEQLVFDLTQKFTGKSGVNQE